MVAIRSAPISGTRAIQKDNTRSAAVALRRTRTSWTVPIRPRRSLISRPVTAPVRHAFNRLPLSTMEHIMFADDRPGHPMTFLLRAELEGQLDPERFVQAFEAARARHPLLCSLIAGSPEACTAELCWVPSDLRPSASITRRVSEGESGETLPLAHASGDEPPRLDYLDPTRELPVQLQVREGPHRSVVDLLFHHAATDGMGALQFLEDLLGFYGRLGGERLPLKALNPGLLPGRGGFRQDETPLWRRLRAEILRGLDFVSSRPRPLAGERLEAGTSFDPIRCEFARPEIARMKSAARAADGTVNDLLLARFFQALDAWNRSHGGERNLRLAMPINLRRPSDQALPAANVITIALLDRTARECAADTLLAGIVEETRRLKSERTGCMMLWAAHVLGHVPGGVHQLMAPRWPLSCGATAVLSNVGPVFSRTRYPRDADGRLRVGGLTLSRVEVLPPVRPGTALSLGVVTYAGRMMISVQHDPSALSSGAARTLTERYAESLRDSNHRDSV